MEIGAERKVKMERGQRGRERQEQKDRGRDEERQDGRRDGWTNDRTTYTTGNLYRIS